MLSGHFKISTQVVPQLSYQEGMCLEDSQKEPLTHCKSVVKSRALKSVFSLKSGPFTVWNWISCLILSVLPLSKSVKENKIIPTSKDFER